MIGVPKEMKKLSLEELGLIYETTLNRVFVFPLEMFIDKAVLRKIKNMNQDNDNFAYLETQLKQGTHFELLNYIERLAQFEENNVYLISRFSKPFVSYCCEGLKNVNILAENGFFYKTNGKDWSPISKDPLDWINVAHKVMKKYSDRIENANILRYDSYIKCKIKGADPGLTRTLIGQLTDELKLVFEDEDTIEVHRTPSKVVVRPFGMNKGVTTQMILQKVFQDKEKIDFLMCFGESLEDEEIFAGAKRSYKYCQEIFPETIKPLCCVLNLKPSEAQYYFDTLQDLLLFLRRIISN